MVGFGERIGNTTFGEDNNCAVNSGSEPEDVSMPPEGTALAGQGVVVCVDLSWLDRALGYVSRPIGPSCSHLSHTVPVLGRPQSPFN